MKFSEKLIFSFLKFFGDAASHKAYEQVQLLRIRFPKLNLKQVVDLFRYGIHNNWIQGVGDDFYSKLLGFRKFKLTGKGDKFLRALSIKYGGERQHFANFDREKAKKTGSDEGAQQLNQNYH